MEPPLPPPELALRVGVNDPSDPLRSFEAVGRETREAILGLLPDGWSFEGKRVLDFGCGSGKVLRHFLGEARRAEFHACDIDAPSVAWLERHMSPPVHAFRNEETPPLPLADGSLDLVWAMSVFTHLGDHWADWLAELHRVLAPDGLLIASWLGAAKYEHWLGEPWDERQVGMNVLSHGQAWDLGGPTVFHSPWWLREHWGRGFEFLELREGQAPGEHGLALLRRRAGSISAAELARSDPGDERETEALRGHVRQLHREVADLRRSREELAAHYEATLSWRLTRPLRAAAAAARRATIARWR